MGNPVSVLLVLKERYAPEEIASGQLQDIGTLANFPGSHPPPFRLASILNFSVCLANLQVIPRYVVHCGPRAEQKVNLDHFQEQKQLI